MKRQQICKGNQLASIYEPMINTLVKGYRKRLTVLAYFEVFCEYFKTGAGKKGSARERTEENELVNCEIGKQD